MHLVLKHSLGYFMEIIGVTTVPDMFIFGRRHHQKKFLGPFVLFTNIFIHKVCHSEVCYQTFVRLDKVQVLFYCYSVLSILPSSQSWFMAFLCMRNIPVIDIACSNL